MNLSAKIVAVLMAVFSTSVLAQSVTVGSGDVSPGNQIVIPVTYTAGSNVGGVDLTVNFANPAKFSSVTVNCSIASIQTVGATNQFCNNTNAAAGSVKVTLANIEGAALTSGKLADITFTVAGGATPSVETLTPIMVGLSDPAGNDLALNLVTVNNGAITIVGAAFSSVPTPATGVTVPSVIQNAPDTSANVVISNTGATGTTLTGSCTETSDPSNVFSLSGDTSFSVLQGTTDTVTVSCDSAGPIDTHLGEMTCTHNGGSPGLSSPQLYALGCTITAGPQPAYSSSNPAAGGSITLPDTEAGDPNPSQSLTITNTGDSATTLTGSCAMAGGSDSQISVNTTGTFNIAQGSAGVTRIVSCDASVQGNYSGTLSCSHNGSSPASPVDYPVSCNVTEAGSAVFASTPVPGPIDVDGGADVVVDDTDPTRLLTFFNNADPGDQNLDIECALSGSAAITVQPDISAGILIAPGANSAVTFSCDTSAAGDFVATYACFHQNGGLVDAPVGDVANAVYNLTCEVRDPEAQVEITPAPGTPQTTSVPPGGSTSFEFDFTEINDEGLDGNLISCDLDTGGQGFTISSPTFPIDILAGDTVTVVVDFTDPTGAETWSDSLTCMFSDSDSDDVEVTWPLTVTIGGGAARFTVLKDFTDGNPGDVTVDLDCNTGLILDQSKTISEDGIGVTFVVTDFDDGELDCNVTERPLAGYSTDYDSSNSDSASTDSSDLDNGCFYTLVNGGDENSCVITNSPDDVDVVITKEWLYPGSADATSVSDEFKLVLICLNAEIIGGKNLGDEIGVLESPSGTNGDFCGSPIASSFMAGLDSPQLISEEFIWCKSLYGSGNEVFVEQVNPFAFPGGICGVLEVDVDAAVEVDSDCGNGFEVSAGSGASCTITNTVFFEGIPTLNQYGMALMALLMLGMGFVAVRRVI